MNKKLAWFAGCTTLAMVVYFGTNLLRAQTAPAKVPIQGTEQRSRIALLNLHHVVKNYQKAVALNNEMKEVFTREGVEHRPIVGGNLLRQPFLKGYKFGVPKKNSNVDLLNDNGVYIGNSHFVTGADMDWLARTLGAIRA